jgi:hypothetical protein
MPVMPQRPWLHTVEKKLVDAKATNHAHCACLLRNSFDTVHVLYCPRVHWWFLPRLACNSNFSSTPPNHSFKNRHFVLSMQDGLFGRMPYSKLGVKNEDRRHCAFFQRLTCSVSRLYRHGWGRSVDGRISRYCYSRCETRRRWHSRFITQKIGYHPAWVGFV